MFFILIALTVLLLDQASKILIHLYMETGDSIAVAGNLLSFTYVRNSGAAFGILPDYTLFFIVVSVVVIVFILCYYKMIPVEHRMMRVGLALQLGGASGNLVDRVRMGYVIDFIDVAVFPPVFNIADAALVVGISVFVFAFLRSELVRP